MSSSLLALAIGPIQEFIAAARRTRDLWFGSQILSELSRAVAQVVHEREGQLIFPDASALDTQDAGIANIILAKLGPELDPRAIAAAAQEALYARWKEYAENAAGVVGCVLDETRWNAQLDDALECYAAWTPWSEETGNAYQTARTRVMRLLDARKRVREFVPGQGEAGVPKSSLDARRESVFKLRNTRGAKAFPLAKGEELDAVGVIKRAGGKKTRYPSVSRVAVDPWLRHAKKCPDLFEKLKKACDDLVMKKDSSSLACKNFKPYSYFPYDGTAVLLNRHQAFLKEEEGLEKEDLADLENAIKALRKQAKLPEPDPYLTVLMADGDRMGQALAHLKSPAEHCAFSKGLAEFAKKAKRLVEEHQGACVYAGGDDVLAFLPVDQALPCARALRDSFANDLATALPDRPTLPVRLTLSVGIALAHCMEPLEDLREYGAQAEKVAKAASNPDGLDADSEARHAERNGLAVMIHPRSGVDFGVREQWRDDETSLDRRLMDMAKAYARRDWPNKFPYDLRKLADGLCRWNAPSEAVQAEAKLLLIRKRISHEPLCKMVEACKNAADLLRLAETLLVSQWLGNAYLQSGDLNPTPAGGPREET
jgi:CRISPR-associated protein Cmr2